MIHSYVGVPGSGKSLHAMQTIKDYLTIYGKPVIANFPVAVQNLKRQKAAYKYIRSSELNPKKLERIAERYYSKNEFSEDGILLVIDEAQLLFNSRTWNEASRKEWIYFFTNSRHFGFKIILCCQFLEMLDKQIRGCIETVYEHRNFSRYGVVGWVMAHLVGGKLFIVIERYQGMKENIGTTWVFGRRSLYKLYDSYATKLFNVEEVENG